MKTIDRLTYEQLIQATARLLGTQTGDSRDDLSRHNADARAEAWAEAYRKEHMPRFEQLRQRAAEQLEQLHIVEAARIATERDAYVRAQGYAFTPAEILTRFAEYNSTAEILTRRFADPLDTQIKAYPGEPKHVNQAEAIVRNAAPDPDWGI